MTRSTSWRSSEGRNQSDSSVPRSAGRVVAFLSAASNLFRGDANGGEHVFVRLRPGGAACR
jgi:hypothetical protein